MQRKLRYAPMESHFNEWKWANVSVPNVSGPANPGASFKLFGLVRVINEIQFTNTEKFFRPPLQHTYAKSGSYIEISASGTVGFMQHSSRPDINFFVKAILLKNGNIIDTRAVKKHMLSYFISPSSINIGEVFFPLPDPVDDTPLLLIIEGIYTARFSEGIVTPISLSRLDNAEIRIKFPIIIVEEQQI
jgi:hypothetical protein